MDNTKGLVFGAVMLAVAVNFVNESRGKAGWSFRPYLGAGIMGAFLLTIAVADERLARNFALLIMLGILVRDKGNLFRYAGKVSNPTMKGKGNHA